MRKAPARLVGLAGTLLLQGGAFFLFLHSLTTAHPPQDMQRELTFLLTRRPPPAPVLAPVPQPERTEPPAKPLPALPDASDSRVPALPDLRNFGAALNDCTPERYASLPPEQKARCPRPDAGATRSESMVAPHSLVQDEAHWESELAREQSPLLLPCTGANGSVAELNFYCLGLMAAKGTLSDRETWPVYDAPKN